METLPTFGKKILLGSVAALALALPARATDYAGNGGTSFGGPVGKGILTLSVSGGNLTGSIAQGGLPSGFNDTLVIYIDAKAGGFTDTSTFADTGGGNDTLRKAVSGFNGDPNNPGAIVNFASGFGADYALALSPSQAQFGALYTLNNVNNFTYGSDGTNGNANLTPTGNNTATTYTFSLPLTLLGSPTSFKFSTTYLDGNGAYRSNEAFGNTITDVTNPANTGNLGQDTGAVGFSTFAVVPEPGTWTLALAGLAALAGWQFRRRQA